MPLIPPSASSHPTPRAVVSSREVKKANTRFVVLTFCASLASFFAAGFYDYIRPIALYQFVQHAENSLLWSRHESCDDDGAVDGSPFESVCELPTTTRVAVRAVVEAAILVPALLLILPLSHRKWRQIRKASKSAAQHNGLNEESSKLCTLLRRASWVLWTLSAVGLVLGIVTSSHHFGVISISALLAFFAQGVHCVGCLVSSYDSDEMSADHKIPAASWARQQSGECKVTKGDADAHEQLVDPSTTKVVPKNVSVKSELLPNKTTLPSSPHTRMKALNRENSDLLSFFFIKIALLQTPYCLNVGLHLFHNCVACALQHRRQFDPTLHLHSPVAVGDFVVPKEIPAVVAFACTILVPLFTHGVGGKLFNGTCWSFHHPFDGGHLHVKCQATGWSLVGLAGFLHLAFMTLGMGKQHAYLLHSGSVLSWFAEGILLYSLLDFRPTKVEESSIGRKEFKNNNTSRAMCTGLWLLLSFVQDFIITNLHWCFPMALVMTILGFNFFSLQPTKCFLCASVADASFGTALLLISWALPYVFVSYSPRRKRWKWNVFGLMNDAFERFACHPRGLFSNSQLKMEENVEDYQRPGAMFAMAPHGTLPTSVVAVCNQYEHIFADTCVFFGSQLDLCPGYRFFFGMRGGFLPVEKRRIVSTMLTGQNIALVPGGVSEMLHCVAHDKAINVSIKHKGFVRVAIQNGYDLVPTFFFHANDQYDNPMRKFQMWTYKVVGVPLGMPVFTNRWGLPFSNRTKIQVALGRRIVVAKNSDPTPEEVDCLHREFYEEILRIWQQHKDEFGYSERELCFIT